MVFMPSSCRERPFVSMLQMKIAQESNQWLYKAINSSARFPVGTSFYSPNLHDQWHSITAKVQRASISAVCG